MKLTIPTISSTSYSKTKNQAAAMIRKDLFISRLRDCPENYF